MRGSKGDKAYCILDFRVPTTSMGARGQRGAKGVKGSKVYSILGFRSPPPLWEHRVRGQRGAKGAKGK